MEISTKSLILKSFGGVMFYLIWVDICPYIISGLVLFLIPRIPKRFFFNGFYIFLCWSPHITFSVSGKFFSPHKIFSAPDLILSQMLTSSSINTQYTSYRSALVKYFFLLSFFSFILLLYLSRINGLSNFTISGFGTARPLCCCFADLYSLVTLQSFDFFSHVISILTSFFSLTNLLPPLHISLCWGIGRTTL